jgi:hypothetical protein
MRRQLFPASCAGPGSTTRPGSRRSAYAASREIRPSASVRAARYPAVLVDPQLASLCTPPSPPGPLTPRHTVTGVNFK